MAEIIHKAVILGVQHAADSLLAIVVRCCGDPLSDSVLTLGGLHRSEAEIDADIQAHCERVEKLHEARYRAAAHIQRLMK